jgi:hypothetical protein
MIFHDSYLARILTFSFLFAMLFIAFASSAETKADTVSFNRDVRPILSDRCFHCHGPDKLHREAELRLDQADGDEGAYQVIKPKSLKQSKLWHRITSDDSDKAMPPSDSHKKPLTAAEKSIIKKWIEEGAQYDTFWAFKKPKIAKPKVTGQWGDGAIDRYVYARLKAASIDPSPEADKRTLLRRVTFDLTGLPPTLKELADFEADTSPDAYEKRVDALLTRPQYGEHMARYWADLVRLGDTDGLHSDPFRDFSTYRDWVIRAFNANLPYDQFIRDQLAGDLYEKPTVDQLVASGFNRLNLMFVRGSVLPEESLHRNVLDRVEAVGTAFLGLTVQCAQCHDHKYDPISQREFFQLYAFFNNFSGDAQTTAKEPNGIQAPSIAVVHAEHPEKLAESNKQLEALKAKLAVAFKPGDPSSISSNTQYWNFDDGAGTTVANQMTEGNVGKVIGTAKRGVAGLGSSTALDLNSENSYVDCGKLGLTAGAAGGEATVSIWLHPDRLSADTRIVGHIGGAASQAGVLRALGNGAIEVWNGAAWHQIARQGSLNVGYWQHLALVWKGDSVTAYVNGIAQQTAKSRFDFGAKNGNFGIGAPLVLNNKKYGASFDGKIDEVAIFKTALSQKDIAKLVGDYPLAAVKAYQAKADQRASAQPTQGRRAMVMRERVPMRKTFIRLRGAYDKLGDEVHRGTPAFLPPLQVAGKVPSRMDLANWLVSPEHPLTARVAVNRFWQQLFGVGLVKTSEDFGAQGEWPSHPLLLDYLAVRFRQSDWDVKALMREIVLSATYKQQSDAPATAYRADPENRRLARGSRYRMDAEMIRDQLLMVSGKINTKLYGKSVKPPQPPGLWKSVTMTNERFAAGTGDAIFRRSVYTFWKRIMPPPQMTILNAPSREYCVARRERTNTPLQALLLMNEPEYMKFARACALRTLGEVNNDPTAALPRLYERITSHRPTAQELATLKKAFNDLKQYYGERPELAAKIAGSSKDTVRTAVWTMLAHSMLNLEAAKVRR